MQVGKKDVSKNEVAHAGKPDTDERRYRMFLLKKLEAAEAQAMAGELISDEALAEEIAGWA